VLKNVAIEPEITHLAKFLTRMGADIEGIGTTELTIKGVPELHPVDTEMIPDRIETMTYVCAAAMAGGKVTLTHSEPRHVETPLAAAQKMGLKINTASDSIAIERRGGPLKPIDLTTEPYPGFPTDLQAPFMAMASLAEGRSQITDTVYKDRFTHVAELMRLGADIRMQENAAVVTGVPELHGAPVMSTDLRASVCLVLAGLAARGTTEVKRIYHLDRGYEKLEMKLSAVGAQISRKEGDL